MNQVVVEAKRAQGQHGQIVVEYFLLFTLVAMLAMAGLMRAGGMQENVRASAQGFFKTAVARMTQSGTEPIRPGNGNGSGEGDCPDGTKACLPNP